MKPSLSNPLLTRCLAVGITSFIFCTSSVFAATYQWDQNDRAAGLGGSGAWDTASAFWDLVGTGLDDGTAVTAAVADWNPAIAVDSATFGGTAGTVTLASAVNGLGTGFTTGHQLFQRPSPPKQIPSNHPVCRSHDFPPSNNSKSQSNPA